MPHILLQQVLEFHKKFNKTIGYPRYPNVAAEQKFRLDLIDEEYTELLEALNDPDLSDRQRVIDVADALGDLAYVIFGAAVCWGIDLASVIDAIHTSNMTKSTGEKRSDGKVLKGPDYAPPQIEQALELAAYDFNKTGGHETEDEDPWWPVPTAIQGEECFYPKDPDQEPTPEATNKIMLAAKDQAKILAMKGIKEDFVPDTKSNGLTKDGKPYTVNTKAVSHVCGSECYDTPPASSQTIKPGDDVIIGRMTSYGAFVFECACGRSHAVQGKLGSRGGIAPRGKAECICGKAYIVDFTSDATPHVTQTTIEELRKLDV